VIRFEFTQFGGWQRPLFQLAEFVAQQLDPLVAILTTAELAHAHAEFAPLQRCVAYLHQQIIVTGVGVQQGQLMRARQQRLVLMLTMDLDQQGRQFTELACVGGTTVDPCPGTAFGADHPAQLAIAVLIQLFVLQPFVGFGQPGQVEFRRQFGTIAAGPYHAAVGTRASQ
jgi:hypothetical protein